VSTPRSAELVAESLTFSYGSCTAVRDVSLRLSTGKMVALAGPNGSGKSTVLKLLSGARRAECGSVRFDGRSVATMSPRERARWVAVVGQHVNPNLAFSVERLVQLGRTPHTGLLGALGETDRSEVQRALQATETFELRARRYSELSGGEQQRVSVAMALAQSPRFLLLDEPTVHLDLQHQHQLLELLHSLRRTRGIGILAVMHDLNVASLYFDRLMILERGRLVSSGPPAEILSRPELRAVFRAPVTVVQHPNAGVPQILLDRSVGSAPEEPG